MVSGFRARAACDQTPPPARHSRSLGPGARRRGESRPPGPAHKRGRPAGVSTCAPLCAPGIARTGAFYVRGVGGECGTRRGGGPSPPVGPGALLRAGGRAGVPGGRSSCSWRAGVSSGTPARACVSPCGPPHPTAAFAFPGGSAWVSHGGKEEGWPGLAADLTGGAGAEGMPSREGIHPGSLPAL